MDIKNIIQQMFDKAAIELASTGMIKHINYGVIDDKDLVPLKLEGWNQESQKNSLATELSKINASGWLTVGVGAIVVPEKEEKKKRGRKSKKEKEKPEVEPKPILSLLAVHRTKTGETDILYSKILQDPRGTYYPDVKEKWINRQDNIGFLEQN